ncbi:MAG: alkaline shock protein Asp23 [Paenibacillus sp.]|nr:alkaline shock protein Asp23 [Paenibacillus sp.]
MPIQIDNEWGKIFVNHEVVSVLAGHAALGCFGLVGMASRKQLKDGITELLGRENLSRGVEVRNEADGVHVELHIIVSYGTRISEVAHNVQARVKYVLNDVIGLKADFVDIVVQGVRVAN